MIMKKGSCAWIVSGMVIGLVAVGQTLGQYNPDTKLWLAQKLSHSHDDWTYAFELNERFYDDLSRWEELYANIGIVRHLSDGWLVSVFLRMLADKYQSDEEQIERRLYGNLEHRHRPFRSLELGFRHRYEYRDFQDAPTKHRFTERIRLSHPILSSERANLVNGYISDEIYYDLDESQITLHEFQLGAEIPSSWGMYQVFWGHEINRRDDHYDYHTNILGFEIGWKF
ncbi:MAG: hypothetical protein A2283_05275 [Lentisphaerae bacterium RIFOXYA12_FULL_48_11]|nr:MAG: hypothetical protein A2283_05275 [Lentisphaerae bacterium RIFOXYA12_FULL_48_11]